MTTRTARTPRTSPAPRTTARAPRPRPTSATTASAAVAEPAPALAVAPAAASAPEVQPPVTPLSGYRGLKVWQRSMDLATAVFHVSHVMADETLAEELWRTAFAIPAYISAGNSLYVRAEYVAQLSAAHGQVARLECLLHLADRIAGLSGTDSAPLLASAADIGRMLRGLARALQPKGDAPEGETVH